MNPLNFLLFAGSLRAGSLNKKLLNVAKNLISANPNAKPTVIDLKELAIPIYDGDVEAEGIPKGVQILGKAIQEADGLVIASPEYNGSIAAPLKNAVDWVSRLKPVPLVAKPVLLLGASPGALGAIRALSHDRAPFETIGSFVYPHPFGLPKANEAFSVSGDLMDAGTQKRLADLIAKYFDFVSKLTSKL